MSSDVEHFSKLFLTINEVWKYSAYAACNINATKAEPIYGENIFDKHTRSNENYLGNIGFVHSRWTYFKLS